MAIFLKPDKIVSLPLGLTIKQKLMPDGLRATKTVASWIKKGDLMKPQKPLGNGNPRGVTIHNTPDGTPLAGTNIAEQYTRATYNGNMGGAVVHFYIYKTEIWQLLRIDEQGWHAGDGSKRKSDRKGGIIGGNLDTIAIECIGDHPQSEDTAAKLAAYLLYDNGLDITDLYTHQYWSGKQCPIYILPHWDSFVNKVKQSISALIPAAPVPAPSPAPVPTPTPVVSFPDVAPDAWYAEMIAELKAAGIVNGYPDGTVKPEVEAKRSEMFTVAAKLLGKIEELEDLIKSEKLKK